MVVENSKTYPALNKLKYVVGLHNMGVSTAVVVSSSSSSSSSSKQQFTEEHARQREHTPLWADSSGRVAPNSKTSAARTTTIWCLWKGLVDILP